MKKPLELFMPAQIELHYCGNAVYDEYHSFGPYIRDHFLIVYIEKGESTLYIENEKYIIKEHNLLVFFPNSKILYKNNENVEWRIWWMGVSGDALYKYFESLDISLKKPFLDVYAHEELLSCFAEINRTMKSTRLEKRLYSYSLMYKIFSILAKDTAKVKLSPIQEIIHYINYNFDTIKNVSELSKNYNMSKNNFLRIFKKETGKSPIEYLEEIRLKRACELLKETDYSIKNISFSIGFNDPLYFSRFFKKHTGLSPANYRKN